MNAQLIDKIARAVLYEGYVLYPYRPAVKNHQRWTFGGLYPRTFSEAQAGADPWRAQTECLVRGDGQTTVGVSVRFLHLIDRRIAVFDSHAADAPAEHQPLHFVPSLCVGEQIYQPWQEAMEREAALQPWRLSDPPRSTTFGWQASLVREPIRDGRENCVGIIVREQQAITAAVGISSERVNDELRTVRVQIDNVTALTNECSRDQATLRSLASTHVVLQVEHGEFLSLIDPPAEARQAAASCQNIGVWPVLVGNEGERDAMLAAPIILYDYPQIAAESPGDLFDGTEIDEILSLRILTLSDDEKRQAASLDGRVRSLLMRTEALESQDFAAMHGVMRPVSLAAQKEPR